MSTAGLSCTEVGTSTPIAPTLAIGSDTLVTSSCSGVSLSGADAADYAVIYTSASGDFTVSPAPVDVAVTGSQTYGGSPIFSGTASPPSGITVSTASLSCTEVYASTSITPTLAAGSHQLLQASCTGASLSGTNAADYEVAYTSAAGDFTVTPAPLTVHGLGSDHDLRGNPTGHQPHLQRLRQLRQSVVAHDRADLHHRGHQLQPGVGLAVRLFVHGGRSDPNYTCHLHSRDRHGQRGAAPAACRAHGYWLVGSDGGIFTFGSATFHGSTGSLQLQRPVVGITPTRDEGGYWLVASDGGIFAFGDAGFYGSIPGLGLHPVGSGLPNSLNAPIVGMVPSSDGGGYFMVASDGGVFAFGDAQFEGSCPGIGGCSGRRRGGRARRHGRTGTGS